MALCGTRAQFDKDRLIVNVNYIIFQRTEGLRNHRSRAELKLAGDALRRLVDLVAHRSGSVFAIMSDAAVTLPQVLIISRVELAGAASLAELASESPASAAALSQMIERLVQQELLDRAEDPRDRRRKVVRVTARASGLIRSLEAARSADYELGLAPLSEDARAALAGALERAALDIEAARRADPRSKEVAR
jgi:DNA-binding MarR family transcriptional regulator